MAEVFAAKLWASSPSRLRSSSLELGGSPTIRTELFRMKPPSCYAIDDLFSKFLFLTCGSDGEAISVADFELPRIIGDFSSLSRECYY